MSAAANTFLVRPDGAHLAVNCLTRRTAWLKLTPRAGVLEGGLRTTGTLSFCPRTGAGKHESRVWHLLLAGETVDASIVRGKARIFCEAQLGTEARRKRTLAEKARRDAARAAEAERTRLAKAADAERARAKARRVARELSPPSPVAAEFAYLRRLSPKTGGKRSGNAGA